MNAMITPEMLHKKVDGLPSLPTSVMSLAELADNDLSTLDDIYRVLVMDPALASSILRLANSTMFASGNLVCDLRTAIQRLGMDAILNLGRGVAVIRNYRAGDFLDVVHLWQHSTTVGLTAKAICIHLKNHSLAEVAFLAGLLHDIGKIVLDRCFNDEYAPVVQAVKNGENELETEKKHLNITHVEVGALMAVQWKFPEIIVEAIRDHHNPKQGSFLTKLIHYSDLLVRTRLPYSMADRKLVLNFDSDPVFQEMIFGISGNIPDIEYLTFKIDDEVDHAISFVQLAYQD